ncbi:competence type IV pilus minor pilin ComGE [Bacillus gobiensis]|uniref:competence type IV pilus minor pilin ComGE n=1 Tax=Bacillus gobiensis TaxID=1441095 RepID=UPI003D23891B
MFKKSNKGFSTIETVSAFSIWVMMTCLLLPFLHQITMQREVNQQKEQSYHLLNAELNHYMFTGEKRKKAFVVGSETYVIDWRDEEDFEQACIRREGGSEKDKHCLSIYNTEWLYSS